MMSSVARNADYRSINCMEFFSEISIIVFVFVSKFCLDFSVMIGQAHANKAKECCTKRSF